MKTYTLIFLLLVFFGFSTKAQIEQLKQEVSELAIGFEKEKPDFAFLDSIVKNKNIVLLGEAGHGDGTAFLLKQELIKYLHEEHGFDNLVMEGGSPFALHMLKDSSMTDSAKILAYRRSIMGVWTYSNEFIPTLEYVVANQLDVIGIESRFPIMNNQYLIKELKNALGLTYDSSLIRFRTLFYSLMGMQYEIIHKTENRDFLNNYITELKEKVTQLPDENQKKQVLFQSLCSMEVEIEKSYHSKENTEGIIAGNNLRDSMMFQNFKAQYNPNEKYIVWLASFHGIKNIQEIKPKDSADTYKRQYLLGNYIQRDFNEESLVFTIVSNFGERAFAQSQNVHKIESCMDCPLVNSLPSQEESYFIPISGLSKGLIDSNLRFNSTIFGSNHKGNWLNQVDGLFVLDKMNRSTYYDEPIFLQAHER